jgi:serine O-acetyltransferase
MRMTELSKLLVTLNSQQQRQSGCIPSRSDVHDLADGLFNFLFPINCTRNTGAEVRYGLLHAQLTAVLQTVFSTDAATAQTYADPFFERMAFVFERLEEDARAFLAFDPAAVSLEEVITTYPGFYAIAIHRMAHELHTLGVPLLPRMMTEYAHGRTGIDMHPAAIIGRAFFIDHGTGIVIGATAEIGDNVKLYQGVTLGALQVEKSLALTKRHPTIEDNVIVYANATILGGQTVVGHDSVIGGNVFVTESIPPNSLVYHKSQVSLRQRAVNGVIDFVI